MHESVLGELFEALIRQDEAASDAAIAALGPHIQHTIREGPETVGLEVLCPWNQLIAASVRSAYPGLDETVYAHLEFLYQHADFMDRHLEQLFQRFEGLFACADKSRWVLECYRTWQIQGILPNWPPEERQYWHSHTQPLAFWLGVCAHLMRLYYGDPDAFLGDLQTLVWQKTGNGLPATTPKND